MGEEFLQASDRLAAWCRDEALPLWSVKGVDETGRFVEQISRCGVPEPGIMRRVRVQFRQAYSLTHAHLLGFGAELMAVADKAMDRAITDSFDPADLRQEHGCFLLLRPDGQAEDTTRDLYTQAFYLLSLAWRYRADRDDKWLQAADRMIAFLEREMASPHGGYVESLPNKVPRRQNPHMHLFEAFLALHKASGASRYLALAEAMSDLFERHFLDADTGCLIEYFTDDWQPDPQESHRIEPGHIMEWAWLLHHFGQQSGRDTHARVRALYTKAIEIGTDPQSGFLLDEVHADATVLKGTRRSWPQTEYLKASIVLARCGDKAAQRQATLLINTLLDTYLDTSVRGIWRDAYGADGAVMPVAAQASSFYHYIAAIGEVMAFASTLREA